MKRCIHILGLVCLAAMTLPSLSAAMFSLTDLGALADLAGRSDSRALAINSQARAAGSSVISGSYRARLYAQGAWTSLGTLGGGESIGQGISDTGRVVGRARISGGAIRAFLWTPGGTNGVVTNPQMRDLGTLGGSSSEAYGVNAAGQVSGYADVAAGPHAFRFSGSSMTDVGAILSSSLGLPRSYGYAINSTGHVAGTAYDVDFSAARAFVYNGATVTNIGNLGGGEAEAFGINDAGRVVGYSITSGGLYHAFRFANGQMTDLGTLGGPFSEARDINNDNVIVGSSTVSANSQVTRAFMTVSNSLVDLNGRLDASGAGWTLEEARGINDAGQVVGVGRLGGVQRGFLLTPIRPRMTSIQVSGTNVVVQFTSTNHSTYVLKGTDRVGGTNWTSRSATLTGGGTLIVTNSGAGALPRQFYKVTLNLP